MNKLERKTNIRYNKNNKLIYQIGHTSQSFNTSDIKIFSARGCPLAYLINLI